MNKYRDIVGRINYGFFLAVVFLLPFPQVCLRYACVAWFIAWILELRWLQKPATNIQLSIIKTILPFLLFGLCVRDVFEAVYLCFIVHNMLRLKMCYNFLRHPVFDCYRMKKMA